MTDSGKNTLQNTFANPIFPTAWEVGIITVTAQMRKPKPRDVNSFPGRGIAEQVNMRGSEDGN